MDYNYLKAVLSFNNIAIFNNYLDEGRLFSNYFYFIYSRHIIKEIYCVLMAIIYNYFRYYIKVYPVKKTVN